MSRALNISSPTRAGAANNAELDIENQFKKILGGNQKLGLSKTSIDGIATTGTTQSKIFDRVTRQVDIEKQLSADKLTFFKLDATNKFPDVKEARLYSYFGGWMPDSRAVACNRRITLYFFLCNWLYSAKVMKTKVTYGDRNDVVQGWSADKNKFETNPSNLRLQVATLNVFCTDSRDRLRKNVWTDYLGYEPSSSYTNFNQRPNQISNLWWTIILQIGTLATQQMVSFEPFAQAGVKSFGNQAVPANTVPWNQIDYNARVRKSKTDDTPILLNNFDFTWSPTTPDTNESSRHIQNNAGCHFYNYDAIKAGSANLVSQILRLESVCWTVLLASITRPTAINDDADKKQAETIKLLNQLKRNPICSMLYLHDHYKLAVDDMRLFTEGETRTSTYMFDANTALSDRSNHKILFEKNQSATAVEANRRFIKKIMLLLRDCLSYKIRNEPAKGEAQLKSYHKKGLTMLLAFTMVQLILTVLQTGADLSLFEEQLRGRATVESLPRKGASDEDDAANLSKSVYNWNSLTSFFYLRDALALYYKHFVAVGLGKLGYLIDSDFRHDADSETSLFNFLEELALFEAPDPTTKPEYNLSRKKQAATNNQVKRKKQAKPANADRNKKNKPNAASTPTRQMGSPDPLMQSSDDEKNNSETESDPIEEFSESEPNEESPSQATSNEPMESPSQIENNGGGAQSESVDEDSIEDTQDTQDDNEPPAGQPDPQRPPLLNLTEANDAAAARVVAQSVLSSESLDNFDDLFGDGDASNLNALDEAIRNAQTAREPAAANPVSVAAAPSDASQQPAFSQNPLFDDFDDEKYNEQTPSNEQQAGSQNNPVEVAEPADQSNSPQDPQAGSSNGVHEIVNSIQEIVDGIINDSGSDSDVVIIDPPSSRAVHTPSLLDIAQIQPSSASNQSSSPGAPPQLEPGSQSSQSDVAELAPPQRAGQLASIASPSPPPSSQELIAQAEIQTVVPSNGNQALRIEISPPEAVPAAAQVAVPSSSANLSRDERIRRQSNQQTRFQSEQRLALLQQEMAREQARIKLLDAQALMHQVQVLNPARRDLEDIELQIIAALAYSSQK